MKRFGFVAFVSLLMFAAAPCFAQNAATLHIGIEPSTLHAGIEPSSLYVGIEPASLYIGIEPSTLSMGIEPSTLHMGIEPANLHIGVEPSILMLMGGTAQTAGWVRSRLFWRHSCGCRGDIRACALSISGPGSPPANG